MIDGKPRIGDEVYIHGYIDEIRNDVVIIRNEGGYFGTSDREIFYYEEDERGYGTMNEADRKTENSSEIPNNCEDLQDWKDRMWAEAIVTEPTISKMEQVETMSCQECKHFHENAVMYLDQCDFCFKDCKYEPKDDPQTERSE